MKRTDDYGHGAGHSSSGDKPQYKNGSLDAMQNNKGYKKDMYDNFTSIAGKNISATVKENTGIQGTGGGTTGNKNKDIAIKSNNGSADYGKGNPFKKHKEKEVKVFKSIQEMRDYAKKKGYSS